jgi:GNAT superfamily N-acetyltransferase
VTDTLRVRPVRPCDVPAVVAMVHELAEFERAPHACHLTGEQLQAALFAARPAVFAHVAVDATDAPLGFALWYVTYSTWEGVHGIWLEDLYVRPPARRTGAGRALLARLAALCVERGYTRLDWSVLEWNPARAFYERLGAAHLAGWLPYRLEGPALVDLATGAHARPGPTGAHGRRDG